MNPKQPAPIRGAIEKMEQGARLIIATDNHPGGRALAGQIEALARESGREDLVLIRDLPDRRRAGRERCAAGRQDRRRTAAETIKPYVAPS